MSTWHGCASTGNPHEIHTVVPFLHTGVSRQAVHPMAGDEYFPIESGGGPAPRNSDRSRGGSSRGRVPPHNIDAEESVLGAMLLSREAIGIVSEMGLTPQDFYRPAHRHIFDAIRALYSSASPADTVTVADELRR